MGANFTSKQWKDLPDESTIVDAAALIDLEDRVTDYADSTTNAHVNDTSSAHTASAIAVSPAVGGDATVQAVLTTHESRLDAAQSGSGAILPWVTATAYIQGQPVTNSGHTYTANNAHTSGATFAGDLASHWTLLPVAKADIGLANVDNTADASKPVSTAQAAADALALAKASNLSDLANTGTARTNLGLGTAATLASDIDTTLAANSDTRSATQKAVKAYVDAHVGGGGAIESLYVPRIAKSPGVRPGRTIYADFNDQDQIGALFDLTNFTFGTDSSDLTGPGGAARAVLVPGGSYPAIQSCITKAAIGMFRNVEIRSRFRVTAGMHPSTIIENVARYLSGNNFMWGRQNWNLGDPHMEVGRAAKPGGVQSAGALATIAGSPDTVTTHIWKQAFRIWEDIVSFKVWKDGTAEPDWQLQVRVGSSGGTRSDIGAAGALFQTVNDTGVVLSELSVTELIDCTENLLVNPDFTLDARSAFSSDGWTSGVIGWSLPTVGGNSKVEWVNVPDSSGVTRRFMHLQRPTLADPVLGNVVQGVYRRTELLGNDRAGRNMASIGSGYNFEVAVTSKANGLAHQSGHTFLGIAVDCYYFDETNSESNVNHAGYYKVIGPNRANSSGDIIGDGTDGVGSWPWRRDRVHLELTGTTAPPNRIDFAIVMHDDDVTGELWMGDFEMRAVA